MDLNLDMYSSMLFGCVLKKLVFISSCPASSMVVYLSNGFESRYVFEYVVWLCTINWCSIHVTLLCSVH